AGQAGAPFVWAHRGASALAPENTLKAFLLAAELGANGIELDVQLTSDGVPVVLHDPFFWSDGTERFLRAAPDAADTHRRWVAQCTWAELAAAPLTHPDGSREAVPRFEEVLEAVPDWLWLDVELKAGAIYDPRLSGVVLGCIRRRPERVLVSSFDHLVLREAAEAEPSLPVMALCDARLVDPAGALSSIPASRICLRRAFLTASDVVRWRKEGLEVSVYGSEILLDLDAVLTWAVSGIFLDDPRLPRAAEGAR
ncbi:MAG TPA: glycerophosphodiester phosphodiesterase, partial [Acidimicrobiales bacterium]|nr:glycerophosphodiester phosphodiesterase [Acidimicrobiales bacterium]